MLYNHKIWWTNFAIYVCRIKHTGSSILRRFECNYSKEQKWNIFVILGNRLRPTGTLLNLNQIEHILDWKSINLSEPSAKINWRAIRWMCAWKSPIRSHMDWGLRGKLLHHSWPSKRWLQTGQTFIRNEPKYINPAYFCHRVSFWLTHGIVTSNS